MKRILTAVIASVAMLGAVVSYAFSLPANSPVGSLATTNATAVDVATAFRGGALVTDLPAMSSLAWVSVGGLIGLSLVGRRRSS